jgi:hypothetical protein
MTPAGASNGAAVSDAHQAELSSVKLRAVKKIRGLEERIKAVDGDLAAERQQLTTLRAEVAVERRLLCGEMARLEMEADDSTALQGHLALQQQQELSLSSALHSLQLSKEEQEAAHGREVTRLMRELCQLQEERQTDLDAEAATAVERGSLLSQLEGARKAEAEARDAARHWEQQELAQREKVAKLKALLAEARVLIKTSNAAVAEARNPPSTDAPPTTLTNEEGRAAERDCVHIQVLIAELRHTDLESEAGHPPPHPPHSPPPTRPTPLPPSRSAQQYLETLVSPTPPTTHLVKRSATAAEDGVETPAQDAGGGEALRRELAEVRQRARRLMEEKEREITRWRATAAQAQARASRAEAMQLEAEAARVAAESAAAAEGERRRKREEQRGEKDAVQQRHQQCTVAGAEDAVSHIAAHTADPPLSLIGASGSSEATALLHMAQQQAARDAEVHDVQRALDEARAALADAGTKEVELRARLRQSEMVDRRASASVDYIKCLVLQLLRTEESNHGELFPALATCLQFSEAEVMQVSTAREARAARGGFLVSLLRMAPSEARGGGHSGTETTTTQMALQSVQQQQQQQQQREEEQARTDEEHARTAIKVLSAQVCDLEEALAKVSAETHERVAMGTELSAARASIEQSSLDREAEERERLYLRNVLQRYMETEDHETMFPVVAMCLRFTAEEVAAIRGRREQRERERRSAAGAVRRLLFGLGS